MPYLLSLTYLKTKFFLVGVALEKPIYFLYTKTN